MAIAAIPEEISRHVDAVLVLSRKELLLKLLDEADNCLELGHLSAAAILGRVAAEEVNVLRDRSFSVEQQDNIGVLRRSCNQLTHRCTIEDCKKDEVQLLLRAIRALIGDLSKTNSPPSNLQFERLVATTQGKYAFVKTSVEDFLGRKHDHLELEG